MHSFLKKLKSIRNWKFPFRLVRRNEYLEMRDTYSRILELEVENDVLSREIKDLAEQRDNLKRQMQKTEWDIVADMDDPQPQDTTSYNEYVSEVAGFHTRILDEKLRHAISVAYKILEESSDPLVNERIKGTIYGFRELRRWGESMVNKKVGAVNSDEPQSEDPNVSAFGIEETLAEYLLENDR